MLLLLLVYFALFAHHSFSCWLLFIKFNCVLNCAHTHVFYAFEWIVSFFCFYLPLFRYTSSLCLSLSQSLFSLSSSSSLTSSPASLPSMLQCTLGVTHADRTVWEESAKDRAHTKKTYIKITQTTINKKRAHSFFLSHSITSYNISYILY